MSHSSQILRVYHSILLYIRIRVVNNLIFNSETNTFDRVAGCVVECGVPGAVPSAFTAREGGRISDCSRGYSALTSASRRRTCFRRRGFHYWCCGASSGGDGTHPERQGVRSASARVRRCVREAAPRRALWHCIRSTLIASCINIYVLYCIFWIEAIVIWNLSYPLVL